METEADRKTVMSHETDNENNVDVLRWENSIYVSLVMVLITMIRMTSNMCVEHG